MKSVPVLKTKVFEFLVHLTLCSTSFPFINLSLKKRNPPIVQRPFFQDAAKIKKISVSSTTPESEILAKKKNPVGVPRVENFFLGGQLASGISCNGPPIPNPEKKPENQSSPRVKRWVRICWLHQNTIIETKQRFSARKEGRFGRICLGTIFKSN